MSALTGRSAFITGGGSGIGLASARAFLRDGAHVLLFGRDAARLARASAQLRDEAPDQARVLTHAGNVADEADVIAAIDQLLNATGRVDIGIANAGTGTLGPLVATTDAQWRHVMDTNLNGTFYTFKHAGAAIARAGGGALCAISSIAGVRTHRFMGPYCASKMIESATAGSTSRIFLYSSATGSMANATPDDVGPTAISALSSE